MVATLAAIVLWFPVQVAPPRCAPVEESVDAAIREKADELQGGESCANRQVLRADVDGDGREDTLILFGVEPRDSGTHSLHFLAVFPSDRARAPVMKPVGARGQRFPVGLSVSGKTVVVDAMEYGDDDAMCCPSKPVQLAFRLGPHELVQQRNLDTMGEGESLPKEQIDRVVRSSSAGVKACYETEVTKAKASLHGEIDLAWTITKEGRVEMARAVGTTFNISRIEACLLEEVARWVFPTAAEATFVGRYPFIFRRGVHADDDWRREAAEADGR